MSLTCDVETLVEAGVTTASRKAYRSDISDEASRARRDARSRFLASHSRAGRGAHGVAERPNHSLRELLNGSRHVRPKAGQTDLVRAGIPWRAMPHDLPRWDATYGQATR